jgi:hypothetical protein
MTGMEFHSSREEPQHMYENPHYVTIKNPPSADIPQNMLPGCQVATAPFGVLELVVELLFEAVTLVVDDCWLWK